MTATPSTAGAPVPPPPSGPEEKATAGPSDALAAAKADIERVAASLTEATVGGGPATVGVQGVLRSLRAAIDWAAVSPDTHDVEVIESASPPNVRVFVLAGNALVPLVLPAEVALAALVEPTVQAANRYLMRQGEPLLPSRVKYEFALVGGELLSDKPKATLAGSGIKHGDIVQLAEVDTALRFQARIEIVSTALSNYLRGVVKAVEPQTAHAVGIATLVAALLTVGSVIWRSRLALPTGYGCAAALGVLALFAIIGTVATARRWAEHTRVRDAFAATSIVLVAAALGAVPHGLGAPNVLLALATVASGTAMLIVLTSRYWAASSALLAVSVLGALAALVSSFWPLSGAQLGISGLVAVVTLITLAPKLSTRLARLPRQPFRSLRNSDLYAHAAGQSYESVSPVDDLVPDQSMLTTEQVTVAARRANAALTGLCLASALLLVPSAWLAIVPHQNRPIHTILLVAAVAFVIIVRARRYKDRVQAVLLVTSALGALAAIAIKYACDAAPTDLSTVLFYLSFVAAIAVPVFLIGTAGWSYLFSPTTRKAVELVHYMLIACIVPGAVYVLNIYTFLRTQGLWWR